MISSISDFIYSTKNNEMISVKLKFIDFYFLIVKEFMNNICV